MELSLRERKKAATRQAISDIATRLFEAHGFEQVTLAQIAGAAGVSVKTIFNYFGSKEELFFDREEAMRDAFVRAVRERPPGLSPTQALRPLLLAGPVPAGAGGCRWSDLDAVYEDVRAFIACLRDSPALMARQALMGQAWIAPLAEASGSVAWAAMAVAVIGLRQQVFAEALMERRSPRTVERRVRTIVGEALDALEAGFAAPMPARRPA